MSKQRAPASEASNSSIQAPPTGAPQQSPDSTRSSASDPPGLGRRTLWTCRATAIALGLLQAWAYRYEATPDGVSYLDVADAYREGRWSDAPNGYWSPLYSWLLALVGRVLRLPPFADFVLAHFANLIAYGTALIAFEYLVRAVLTRTSTRMSESDGPGREWIVLAYALFVWAMLNLIGLGVTTPDVLLSAAAFGVVGVLTRVPLAGRDWRRGAALGVIAGFGCLSKAAFFPLTVIVVFPAAGLLWWRSKRTVLPAVVAGATFVIVCAPYVVALSRAKEKITWGESGRIAYAWIVNNVPGPVHWQGGPPGAGTPIHPTRQISVAPAVYEFATPLVGTYPPWYDPSYWYDGVQVQWDPLTQARIGYRDLPLLVTLLTPLLLVLVAGVVATGALGRCGWRDIDRVWPLIALGAAGIAMYATIFLETRYIAPFAVMLWFGVLLLLDPFMPSAWRRGLFLGATAVVLLETLPRLMPNVRALSPGYRNQHWEDAAFVLRSGVSAGDPIAVVGDGMFAYWARLARVRIVAEVPSAASRDFWASPPDSQQRVLQKVREAGAVAIVAAGTPAGVGAERWRVHANGRLSVLPLIEPGRE